MEQWVASPAKITSSMARLLGTGKVPGWPKQIGQTAVLGALSSLSLSQEQNILLLGLISAWISKPMMASYFIYYDFRGKEQIREVPYLAKSTNSSVLFRFLKFFLKYAATAESAVLSISFVIN